MAGFLGFGRRGRHERTGFELYGAAVTAARDPYLYTALGVPDTLDGRFDLVGLHAFLLIRRLKREPAPGPEIAQAVFDAMFSDMDINLREMGVGDMSVGKRVRAMWEAFHGRANAYTNALEAAEPGALDDALSRNLWRGADPQAGAVAALARLVRAQDGFLNQQTLTDLKCGKVRFLAVQEGVA